MAKQEKLILYMLFIAIAIIGYTLSAYIFETFNIWHWPNEARTSLAIFEILITIVFLTITLKIK